MEPKDGLRNPSVLHRPDASAKELNGVAWVANDTYAVRWDQWPEGLKADFGDIGEDANGVFARIHPEVLLAEEPALHRVVSWFRRTGDAVVSRADLDELSCFEAMALSVIGNAQARKVKVKT